MDQREVNVGFSDDRFLRCVLVEAQRGAEEEKVKRISEEGFTPEVAQIALHVAHGNEQRALEICMSGLGFMGRSPSWSDGRQSHVRSPCRSAVARPVCERVGDRSPIPGALRSPSTWSVEASAKYRPRLASVEGDCGPQTIIRCHVCGQRYLTEKSLAIHLKACRKRFEQRQAKLPVEGRQLFLERSELPSGVDFLEQLLEPDSLRQEPEIEGAELDPRLETRQADADDLVPCEHCNRTFRADRVDRHRQACVCRPKDPCPLPPSMVWRSNHSRRSQALRTHQCELDRCPGPTNRLKALLAECEARARVDEPHKQTNSSTQRKCDGVASTKVAEHSGTMKAKQLETSTKGAPLGSKKIKWQSVATQKKSQAEPCKDLCPGPKLTSACAARRRHALNNVHVGVRRLPQKAALPRSNLSAAPRSPSPGRADVASVESLVESGLLSPCDSPTALRALTESLPSAEFVASYQVHAGPQCAMFEALRENLRVQRGSDNESLECELWHGTTWASVPKILRSGFNRSFAGRHGTRLGIGTYFSTDLAYSHRFCEANQKGTKVILLARVLVGRYCKGTSTDVEPPLLDESTGERYDSTVDNEEKPSIFAVFRDFQALPLLLLEFR
uniref:Poly [ADP-ribose] polymerase n=1 Tax=Noctiluca scintillans TaxID=2966 RepID=A0A7S0ZXP1_NOCSC